MRRTAAVFIFLMTIVSCRTIDIEKKKGLDISEENRKLTEENERLKETISLYTKEEEYEYDIEPKLIPVTQYVIIDKKDYSPDSDKNKAEGREAVKQSLKDSIRNLKDYTGGMGEFDYDGNYQFPVFTRKLSMTTIILNNDEVMTTDDVFLSDSKSWEITGDIWPSPEGERQLIMIKPLSTGLETDMLVVTNKRLYKFILYSTSNDYQPMVRFRYPSERKFITSNTKKVKAEKIVTSYEETNMDLLSCNYKVYVPVFQKKTGWVPEMVYDDGSFTYIKLPEEVLQKEMPVLYENGRNIVNYEFHPKDHNLIIVNKLIEKLTLRLGKRKITIKKKKGEAAALNIKR